MKRKSKIKQKLEIFKYKLFTKYKTIGKLSSLINVAIVHYQVKQKVIWILQKSLDITITGLLVWLVVPFANPLRIGLGIALAFYFYETFIQITKRKYK